MIDIAAIEPAMKSGVSKWSGFDKFAGKPWAPLYYTKPVSARSRGWEIIDFMETFMTVPTSTKVAKAGSPLKLTEWQKALLLNMFEENEEGILRYQTYLWGVARKNGKSLILTGICLYFLTFGGPGHQIIAAASSAKQADIIFGEAKKQVLRNPYLSKIIKPYKSYLLNKMNDSTFKTVPADSDKAQGLGGSVIVFDEIHAADRPGRERFASRFWRSLSSSRNNREESIMIGITTAGHSEFGTLLGNLHRMGMKGSEKEPSYDNRFGFAWWAVPSDGSVNPLDENNWYMANPNLAEGMMTLETMRGDLEEAREINQQGDWMRLSLNMWVKLEGEYFLSSVHWKEAEKIGGDIPIGAKVVAGFDGSIGGTGDSDSTVIVIMDYETGIFKIWQEWRHPGGGEKWHVGSGEVEASLANMFANYDVVDIFFDGSGWDLMLHQWAIRWPNRITRIPQTRQRITPMANNFMRDISEKKIFHTGDEKLSEYVANAVRTEDGGYAKQKRAGIKIDGLVSSVLANAARNEHQVLEMRQENWDDEPELTIW